MDVASRVCLQLRRLAMITGRLDPYEGIVIGEHSCCVRLRISLLVYCVLAQAAAAQDFVAKSKACVDLIRQKTPQSPIRAGATERNCPLPDIVVSAFAEAPKHAWLAEGDACLTPLDGCSRRPAAAVRYGRDRTRCLGAWPLAHSPVRRPLPARPASADDRHDQRLHVQRRDGADGVRAVHPAAGQQDAGEAVDQGRPRRYRERDLPCPTPSSGTCR